MSSEYEKTFSVRVPPEQAFRAFTDPNELEQWFTPKFDADAEDLGGDEHPERNAERQALGRRRRCEIQRDEKKHRNEQEGRPRRAQRCVADDAKIAQNPGIDQPGAEHAET